MFLLYQVDVVMTPPRIEQVRTPQTRVIFGENFQVGMGSHLKLYLSFPPVFAYILLIFSILFVLFK